MPEERWPVLGREVALQHPYVRVTMERVELPDGRVIDDWPIVETRDYANVAVFRDDGRMMVLEGYKHGLGRSTWQTAGGYIEPGEEPLAAIKRELLEETGYGGEDWKFLGSYVMDANRGVGRGHFFMVRDARQVAPPDHDDLEDFDVRWVTPEEARAALGAGRVGVVSYAINIALALLETGVTSNK